MGVYDNICLTGIGFPYIEIVPAGRIANGIYPWKYRDRGRCSLDDIKDFVKKTVHRYGTNDPYTLCNLLGITVRQTNLLNVRGIYQHNFRKKIIHINCTLGSHVKRQVLAHELGHALLHKKINTAFLNAKKHQLIDTIEVEANIFASELLRDDVK